MRKTLLYLLLGTMMISLYGCGEEKKEYSKTEGVAEGSVNLEEEEPEFSISNIKAKVGTDIDYLTDVNVKNEDKFPDLQIWVDASAVDIYEPGDYKAKYTFEYDGKTVNTEITVTIYEEKKNEESAAETPAGGGNEYADTDNGGNASSNGNSETVTDAPVDTPADTPVDVPVDTPSDNSGNNQTDTPSNDSVTKPTDAPATEPTGSPSDNQSDSNVTKPTKKPSGSSEKTTTKKNNQKQTTTKREMITSKGKGSIKDQNIGYSYIELLSGKTISIKSTTKKYIASTRTDISYKTKSGKKYKVSKLIITYNTGEERTLETVEEKVK